jgi:hypothetical protein
MTATGLILLFSLQIQNNARKIAKISDTFALNHAFEDLST